MAAWSAPDVSAAHRVRLPVVHVLSHARSMLQWTTDHFAMAKICHSLEERHRPTLRQSLILKQSSLSFRSYHRILSTWLLLVMASTALTGASWSVLRYWFDVDKKRIEWLLVIHQGSYINAPLYVTVLGLSFLSTIISGIRLLPVVQRAVKWSKQRAAARHAPLASPSGNAQTHALNQSNAHYEMLGVNQSLMAAEADTTLMGNKLVDIVELKGKKQPDLTMPNHNDASASSSVPTHSLQPSSSGSEVDTQDNRLSTINMRTQLLNGTAS